MRGRPGNHPAFLFLCIVPGMDPKKQNPAVARYAAKVGQPKIPNLNVANAIYNPREDGASTIENLGRTLDAGVGSGGFLKPETIEGLKQLKTMTDKIQNQQNPVTPPTTPVTMEPSKPESPNTDPAPKVAEARAEAALSNLDDLEYERLLRLATQDILNNDVEKEAVKKRVAPIDLTEGLMNNAFIQEVPITPALKVTFRSVTALEVQSLRVMAREFIAKHPRLADLESEIYNFMLAVAAVEAINSRQQPRHLTGSDPYKLVFDEAGFTSKYETFQRYPSALLHALIVHAAWFDQRVRELFKWSNLGNG